MKLSSGGTSYPKFNAPGDMAEGKFLSYTRGRAGKFGPENVLLLEDGDQVSVRCPASLSKTIEKNESLLKPGVWVRVTHTKSVPTNKGNPAKIFDVELFDAEPARAPLPPSRLPSSMETQPAPSEEGTEGETPF